MQFDKDFIQREIECAEHNLREAMRVQTSPAKLKKFTSTTLTTMRREKRSIGMK